MRSRILLTVLLTAFFVIASGCGNVKNCPVCGTTTADGYADIINIPVPEHNPSGEPGGPFNSFDISWVDHVHHLAISSDRLGLAVVVFDTVNNIAVNAIQGTNAVTGAGSKPVPVQPGPGRRHSTSFPQSCMCLAISPDSDVERDMTGLGGPTAPTFHLISGFGANHQLRRISRVRSAAPRVPTA